MNSNGSSNSKGLSDSDNEMAGRLLLMGVFSLIALAFLAITPILVSGFLIGLIWYGAYMEDGEPDGGRVAWPIAITFVSFVIALGFFPPLTKYYEGALFTDFARNTNAVILEMLRAVNEVLPKTMKIHGVTANQVRLYGWSAFAAGIGVFAFLVSNGGGRGVFLYQGARAIFTPFRLLASDLRLMSGVAVLLVAASLYLGWPLSVRLTVVACLLGVLVYRFSQDQANSETAAEPKQAAHEPFTVSLGHERGKPNKRVSISEQDMNHHVHIVGASGFGKSVLLSHLIRARIASRSGLLFVDLKADFETIRQVVSVAKALGRLDDLKIFSIGNPEISSPYNVIGSGTANQLKDRIMGALIWSEEYYKNEAQSFLLKLFRGLVTLRDQKIMQFDLMDVLKCLNDPRNISEIASKLPVSQEAIRLELESLSGHLMKTENLRALQGLKSQIESLLLSDFGHLLKQAPDAINLFNAIRDRKIVFVLLDSRTYGESSKALGKLILQDLKAASARVDNEISRDQRTPFGVIIDEFADMASEDFVSFLDRARSSKIGVTVAHQEIADLSRISPEFARRLMNSTSTLFAFLQKLPDSSELISGIAGTKKTKEVTEQAKSNWLFGDEKTGMKSIKEVDEFVIHPNVVRSLSVGECVLIQKYPKSKAVVLKVRPETTTGYLSEQETRNTLESAPELTEEDFEGITVIRFPTEDGPSEPKRELKSNKENDGYWRESET